MDDSDKIIDVVYPTKGGPFPLISFLHGFAEGNAGVMESYAPFLLELSSWGFVVVAPRACTAGCVDCRFVSVKDPPCYGHYYKQQLLAIDWAKFHAHATALPIDRQAAVGIAGHSMGGQATMFSSGKDEYAGYNITAAVMIHPYTHTVLPPKVPTLVFTGTADTVAPPAMAREIFNATLGEARAFVNAVNKTHFEPEVDVTNLPHKDAKNYNPLLAKFVAAWFKIFVTGERDLVDQEFNDLIFGSAPTSLCHGGDGIMEECLTQRNNNNKH